MRILYCDTEAASMRTQIYVNAGGVIAPTKAGTVDNITSCLFSALHRILGRKVKTPVICQNPIISSENSRILNANVSKHTKQQA
jgi:hypothetical protein